LHECRCKVRRERRNIEHYLILDWQDKRWDNSLFHSAADGGQAGLKFVAFFKFVVLSNPTLRDFMVAIKYEKNFLFSDAVLIRLSTRHSMYSVLRKSEIYILVGEAVPTRFNYSPLWKSGLYS